jgi:hypothetical protein
MCGKYLSVIGEYAEVLKRIWRIWQIGVIYNSQNCLRIFKRIQRVRGKNLYEHGEDAKRLFAYSPNTPKDIKVFIYFG